MMYRPNVLLCTHENPGPTILSEQPIRRYIRHTLDVPLEVKSAGDRRVDQGVNVSHGGLAFLSDQCLDIGDIVDLRIPSVEPPFEAQARVVWCRPERKRFLVGVEFLDPGDAFKSRMVEQVCSIESYRERIRETEGRALTSQEAAAEWITKFAGRFPHADEADGPGRGAA